MANAINGCFRLPGEKSEANVVMPGERVLGCSHTCSMLFLGGECASRYRPCLTDFSFIRVVTTFLNLFESSFINSRFLLNYKPVRQCEIRI
jgi:hypothetical protein